MSGCQIDLNEDQALVLFEWLSVREGELAKHAPDARMNAEDLVLGFILGRLEKTLVAPFAADYQQQLEASRRRIAGA